jgi:hypothetical protein
MKINKYDFNDLAYAMEVACEKKIYDIYFSGEITEERIRKDLEAAGCTIEEFEFEDKGKYIEMYFSGYVYLAANEAKGIKVPFFYQVTASSTLDKENTILQRGTFYGVSGISTTSDSEDMIDFSIIYDEFYDYPGEIDINDFIDEKFDVNEYSPIVPVPFKYL